MNETGLRIVLRRMGCADTTGHGFCSMFRDWAAETTAYPNFVVEMVLARAVGYKHGDLFEKRRQLMQDWAGYCSKAVTAKGGVVPLRQGV
jgi:hypothetical protein